MPAEIASIPNAAEPDRVFGLNPASATAGRICSFSQPSSIDKKRKPQRRQCLSARGESGQHRVEQLLDEKEQPRSVIFRIVEDTVLPHRLLGLVGMERRPEIAGSHAVETICLRPETLAQSHRRQ